MTPCLILCGLYLQLGVAALDGRGPPHDGNPQHDAWFHDVARPLNPYATVEAGWSSPAWRGLNVDVAGRHMSGSGRDHGFNTAEVRVRWHPWTR
jgi:hypothetical protein